MTRVQAPLAIERRGYNRTAIDVWGSRAARQEAALWEAKYLDSVGKNGLLLLEDVLGILLQKTKVKVWVLRARLHKCNLGELCNSDDDNNRTTTERLAPENKALSVAN